MILEVEIWLCLCYVGVLFGFGEVICYLLVCLFVCFENRVSLCSSDCSGIHYVDQTSLELTEICLPFSPKCWDTTLPGTWVWTSFVSLSLLGKKVGVKEMWAGWV